MCEPGEVGHDRLKGGWGWQMGKIKTSRDIFAIAGSAGITLSKKLLFLSGV